MVPKQVFGPMEGDARQNYMCFLYMPIHLADLCYIYYMSKSMSLYYILIVLSEFVFLLPYIHIRLTPSLHRRCYILIRLY